MSRYVLTQEQLDRLQDEVQQLARLNEEKQERIKEMEFRKGRASNADAEHSKTAAKKLKDEIKDLKKSSERQSVDLDASETASVKQLKMLLEEERKLREYSEEFAKQAGLKWAEESLLRELTTELCELQKAEIEVENKRIQELQEKIEKLTNENENHQRNTQETKLKKIHDTENVTENNQLNFITEQLKLQLHDLCDEIQKNPVNEKEDDQQIQEIEKWMRELDLLVKEINDIESLRKDLEYMRNEIENRRKSLKQ